MPAAIDLTGRVYGKLTVIRFVESRIDSGGHARRIYLVRCACGVEKELPAGQITSGKVVSCGCVMRETVRRLRTKHGHAGSADGIKRDSAEYRSWRAMNERCHNTTNIGYANYGGRGITVCAEWRHEFRAFLAHVGTKPSPLHTIDRIDNARGYEPGNVRWATRREQNLNRSDNRILTIDGVSQPLAKWAMVSPVKSTTITSRLARGWSTRDAVFVESDGEPLDKPNPLFPPDAIARARSWARRARERSANEAPDEEPATHTESQG